MSTYFREAAPAQSVPGKTVSGNFVFFKRKTGYMDPNSLLVQSSLT